MADCINKLKLYGFVTQFNVTDFLIIIFLYIFFKCLIFLILTELTWPTQYFNRKHTTGYINYRYRTYTETLLKLHNYPYLYNLFTQYLMYYYFYYNKN